MGLNKGPKVVIRDLLRNQWDETNTSIDGKNTSKPRIHTGWFNGAQGWGDIPQVTITNKNENPIGGSTTGFNAIKPDGSGPVKTMIGTVRVVCWAHQDMYDDVNAKMLTFEFSEEVKRVIKANLFPSDPSIEWLSFIGPVDRVDVDADPVLFRQDCEVRYMYFDYPA